MPLRQRGQSGFTLVEALVALVIGMIVIGACYELMRRARQSTEEGVTASRLGVEANDLLHRIADLLRQASTSSPDWALAEDGSAVTYNPCQGSSGGAVLWGDPLTLAALPAEGDPGGEGDDGTDNDADGLVDERSLVIQDASSGIETACWAVNLKSLRIVQEGRALEVTVTLQGTSESVSASTTVFTRN